MTIDELPASVRDLIQRSLPSLDHVEALLMLHEHPMRDYPARQVAERIRLPEPRASEVLAGLVDGGLIVATEEGFRLRPSPANARVIKDLAQAYHARPVSLVQAIHSRIAPLTAFTDVLRPRSEPPKEER